MRANNFPEIKYSLLNAVNSNDESDEDQDVELPIIENNQTKKDNEDNSVLIFVNSDDECDEDQDMEHPTTPKNQIKKDNEDNELLFIDIDKYQDIGLPITHNNRKRNNRNEGKLRAHNLPKDSVLIPVDTDDESDGELLLIDNDDASDDDQNKIITGEKKFTINGLPNEMLYKILEEMHKQITTMSSNDLLSLLRFSQTSHRMNASVWDLAEKTGLSKKLRDEMEIYRLELAHHPLREKLADWTPPFNEDNAKSVFCNELKNTDSTNLAIKTVVSVVLVMLLFLGFVAYNDGFKHEESYGPNKYLNTNYSAGVQLAIAAAILGATFIPVCGLTVSSAALIKTGLFCNKQTIDADRNKINAIRNPPSPQ